ncbi:DnaJ -like protein subfamily C member 8 [Trichinella britovi]|uniref:DnaJ-like protein subfamily C member 8 n=2 Tax=Trichinella TaxID=6333 RepID=A0A0V1CZV9_TRIBR|nr:DnaJ -like protein subfamily C member 8 [Trichinella sp. T9]KRY54743.1 DnaJ -like protein subfamily C member 8 [Trichinella britovi]
MEEVDPELLFSSFYSEVKAIEKRDSVLNSKEQIHRLTKPGSTYLNLNPYDVLLLPLESTVEEMRKQYRRLSILVHPDKNPDDRESAQKAFDILKKAIEMLEDPEQRARIQLIYEEAKSRTDKLIADKRKAQKKESGGKVTLLEDNPEYQADVDDALHYFDNVCKWRPRDFSVLPNERGLFYGGDGAVGQKLVKKISSKVSVEYEKLLWMNRVKILAERERKRRMLAEREVEDKKRAHLEKQELLERRKAETEWQKNYEESRDCRVSSWKDFQKKKKGRVGNQGFRMPKHRAEARDH